MTGPAWVEHAIWWQIYPLGFVGAFPEGSAPADPDPSSSTTTRTAVFGGVNEAVGKRRGCRRGYGPTPSPALRSRRRYIVHKLIDGLLAGPCDAAEQSPLDLIVREVRVSVSLHPDERPERLAAD